MQSEINADWPSRLLLLYHPVTDSGKKIDISDLFKMVSCFIRCTAKHLLFSNLFNGRSSDVCNRRRQKCMTSECFLLQNAAVQFILLSAFLFMELHMRTAWSSVGGMQHMWRESLEKIFEYRMFPTHCQCCDWLTCITRAFPAISLLGAVKPWQKHSVGGIFTALRCFTLSVEWNLKRLPPPPFFV